MSEPTTVFAVAGEAMKLYREGVGLRHNPKAEADVDKLVLFRYLVPAEATDRICTKHNMKVASILSNHCSVTMRQHDCVMVDVVRLPKEDS